MKQQLTAKPPFFGPVLMSVSVFHGCSPGLYCMGGCGAGRSEAQQVPMQYSANSLGVLLPKEVFGHSLL